MSSGDIGLLCGLFLPFAAVALWWRQRLARRRFLAVLQAAAEKRKDIDGHPAEFWLDLINRNRDQPLIAMDTMVLSCYGQEWLVVSGGIMFETGGNCPTFRTVEGFFVIAIGKVAVDLLAERRDVFRFIAGSEELALFSIFRWARFIELLEAPAKGGG